MSKIWCWHPKKSAPVEPVDEENYQCFFGRFTATCGFKAFLRLYTAVTVLGCEPFVVALLVGMISGGC
ncbi:unnamed protein product, partial [Mesorhabditis belari]|uniref:Uncharacterized protein n=1 Tax=Mesorhabditis belari TaxID=2138241 RepID=A0AAF3FA34_9BILA